MLHACREINEDVEVVEFILRFSLKFKIIQASSLEKTIRAWILRLRFKLLQRHLFEIRTVRKCTLSPTISSGYEY